MLCRPCNLGSRCKCRQARHKPERSEDRRQSPVETSRCSSSSPPSCVHTRVAAPPKKAGTPPHSSHPRPRRRFPRVRLYPPFVAVLGNAANQNHADSQLLPDLLGVVLLSLKPEDRAARHYFEIRRL